MESPEENVSKTSSTLPTSVYSTDSNETTTTTTTTTTVNNMQEDVRTGKSTYLQVYSIF